jgi:alpha-beta hydrolase superfamily lysophospholipase
MDLRGHGRSEGPRADIERLEWALADLSKLLAQATGTSSGEDGHTPVSSAHPANGPRDAFLLGHSLGGALAAAYAATSSARLRALVLSAPALHLASRPRAQALAAWALARVAPSAGVARVVPAQLNHDEANVSRYSTDALVWHGKVPARTAVELYRAGRFAMRHAGEITVPVLVLHGEDDQIVPVGASRRFFSALGSADKELRVFQGFYHEPLQEIGNEEVMAGLVSWLRRH